MTGPGRACAGRREASRFASRGWMMMSTSAMTMNTGTIASNADAGSSSSATAPTIPPVTDAMLSCSRRCVCVASSRR